MRPSVAPEPAAPPAPAPPAGGGQALAVGLGALALVVTLFVAGWLSLLLHARPGAVAVILALVAATVAAGATARRWSPAVAALALALGAGIAAEQFHDLSWDGQVYHQEAVLALAEGWNPLHDPPRPVQRRPDDLWLNHYPKGAWIAQAALFAATGHLESAKGIQLLLLAAGGLLLYAALRTHGAPAAPALVGSLLAAANPVALAQSFSFYVDGMVASLLTILVALAALLWHRPQWALLLATGAALVLLPNLKFTGVVYGGVLLAGAGALWRWRRRPRAARLMLVGGTALLLGTVVLGFDPYVTNLRRAGHPFHPVAGARAVDFIGIQLEPAFHRHPPLVRFFQTTFARSSNVNAAPVPKLPLTVGADEVRAMSQADTRVGGFGPFFGAALLVTAGLLCACRPLRLHLPRAALGAGAVLLAAALFNPVIWWARYVPQLWLLPTGTLALILMRPPAATIARACTFTLALLLALDVALVAGAALSRQGADSARADRQLAELAVASARRALPVRFAGFEANRQRLRAAGVRVIPLSPLPCAVPLRLVGSRAELCSP
jgi:hypothetical protein